MKVWMNVAALAVVAMVAGEVAEAAPRQKARGSRAAEEDTYEAPRRSMSAQGRQNMAGCGLGSMVIKENEKFQQVLAATLNGTGVQTSGMTFGTSNCTEDGMPSAAREKDAFVEANYADLRRDLTVGEGAYLSSLASLYGCRGEAALGFGRALHKNQDKILSANPEAASSAIDSVVVEEGVGCQG